MIAKINIWPEGRTEFEEVITTSVVIEYPNRERTRLWYSVPVEQRAALTASHDPFVLGTVFMAMGQAVDLVVHAEVSPSLLRNLEEFQAAWTCWRPERYTKVEITADVEHEPPRANNLAASIAAFSGGADSCFTVWRHQTGRCGRLKRNIQAGVMVHGFVDTPLEHSAIFKRAAARSARILTSLGLQLIPIATNFRELGDDWEDAHGAGLGSCLLMFQGGYAAGLIGSSRPYQAIIPWGSNPVTDWMMSSDSFQIIHDGAAFIRREKLREIANWPEAMQNLRVCWQGEQKDRNCGRCEKCIRTILSFRVMALPMPPCFEQDITDRQILDLHNLQPGHIYYLNEILDMARAASISESWVVALEKCLHENRLRANGQRSFRQQIRNRVPLTLRRSIRRLIGKEIYK